MTRFSYSGETMSDDRVMRVFSWYKLGMRSVGRRVDFPEGSDDKKTYLWRQLKTFVDKIDELGLDDNTARELVHSVIKHGKAHKLLNRGASLLNKVDLLKILQDKLESDLVAELGLLDEIKRCDLFLSEQQKRKSRLDVLLDRKRPDAYANITCWFQSRKLTQIFIALSKSCCRALNRLDEDERSEFPPDITLLKIRMLCLRDQQRIDKIRKLMDSDLHRRRR